jgi:hypothetical protein
MGFMGQSFSSVCRAGQASRHFRPDCASLFLKHTHNLTDERPRDGWRTLISGTSAAK